MKKFEKQGSGPISISFEPTPINRQFGDFRGGFDELSFTKKSEDMLFANNNAFGDYVSSSNIYRGKT